MLNKIIKFVAIMIMKSIMIIHPFNTVKQKQKQNLLIIKFHEKF